MSPNTDVTPGLFPWQGSIPILDLFGLARTMEINAHEISGLDPGAIPGGSTKSSQVIAGKCGADQHRQTCKGVAFSRHGPPFRAFKLTANDNFAEEFAVAA